MSSPVFIEKQVEFSIPAAGKKCKTWYKVFGDLANRTHRPLIALHGGPGISHEYLLPLVDLTNMHSIPLILYDQVGTGFSTHIPEKKGDTTFWTIQLFLDELDNLLTHLGVADDYDLLGHSWGGMLAASHAVQQPAGLKHLVLASSLPDMNIWLKAQWEHREQLPKEVQDILAKHEAAGTRDSAEYQGATMPYISSAVCRLNPMPEDLAKSFQWMSKDFTVASTMYGPGQWEVTGTLKDWSIISELHQIIVPTLVTNGHYDQAKDSVVVPFFKEISRVKWVTFANSSHMPHFEERERFMEVVGGFLGNN